MIMKKILVIGCPGAGKSVFSRRLSKILGIPVYHLDMVYWKPDVKVENGEGKFHFNTSDGNSNYTVVIEGITNDGEYVFSKQEITRKRDY